MTPFTFGTTARVPTTSSSPADGAPQRPGGVLVADDDDAVRRVLGAGMRSQGFVVWLAVDGPEAIDLYRIYRDSIGVVLLDVRMPGLDGPGTFAALREINPDIRCCFMSGDPGHYTDQMLLDLGAAGVFRKPFPLGEVAQQLACLASTTGPDEGSRTAAGTVEEGIGRNRFPRSAD